MSPCLVFNLGTASCGSAFTWHVIAMLPGVVLIVNVVDRFTGRNRQDPGLLNNRLWRLCSRVAADDSALGRSGRRSSIVLAGLESKLLMVAFEQAESMLAAESWHELRYQHVVERPREQVEGRLSYLQLEWTDWVERSITGLKFPPAGATMYRDELTRDVGVPHRAVRPVLAADVCQSDG